MQDRRFHALRETEKSRQLLWRQRFGVDVLVVFVGPYTGVAAIGIGNVKRQSSACVGRIGSGDHLPVADPEPFERIATDNFDNVPGRISGLGDGGGALVVGLVLGIGPGDGVAARAFGHHRQRKYYRRDKSRDRRQPAPRHAPRSSMRGSTSLLNNDRLATVSS